MPRSLGGVFQNYLQAVLPAILDGKIFQYLSLHLAHWFSNNLLLLGLADENESVRDAALSAGHVFVEHYATTYALLFELVTWFFAAYWYMILEGQAWFSSERCLTESPGRGIETASPHLLGERLALIYPFSRPYSCGSLRHWVCLFYWYIIWFFLCWIGHYLCCFLLLRMGSSVIIGVSDKVPLNFLGISYSRSISHLFRTDLRY